MKPNELTNLYETLLRIMEIESDPHDSRASSLWDDANIASRIVFIRIMAL